METNLTPEAVARCVISLGDVQSSFDQKIAFFIERFGSTLSSDSTIKLLDILDRISDCTDVRFILLRLRSSTDLRIRSKVAMLLCRSALNVRLIEEQLTSKDARIRANAIESIWRIEKLLPLLRNATLDPHNRVMGNALLALYKLGAADAAAETIKMAHHQSEAFQVTALWVMGETLDARFDETLRSLAHTGTGRVRWMALRSLGRIKRASEGRVTDAQDAANAQLPVAAGPG